MKSKRKLTQEERYVLGYMGGYRIGRIQAKREMLIRSLHIKGKEQGCTPSKATICKINREIDMPWMDKVFYAILADQLSLEAFELYYDRLFLATDGPVNPDRERKFDKRPLQGTTGCV